MAAAGGLTGGHPPSVRYVSAFCIVDFIVQYINNCSSRNIAIFSVIGMIAGGWMFFRAQSPSKEEKLYSQKDIHTMVGGQTGENRVGRAPSHQKKG
ncbi:hypothetical protein BO85DRAFT_452484 [Aspergillus piperis CBS 112811]|uniref:Uncharacterized protein n=1 Tax=Aspergillus piperis CBS 112811 TaxID=1448313 RepID=A0A8G1QUW3_9EURO|nr:hypothetical protein BO85DRAFT_452484 [Aspergillus piperis CBS 112811]RAH54099.1 hypothetical protein BO85DRAFT_452484 [Aspergillus piperis CBS 112811]